MNNLTPQLMIIPAPLHICITRSAFDTPCRVVDQFGCGDADDRIEVGYLVIELGKWRPRIDPERPERLSKPMQVETRVLERDHQSVSPR